MGHYKDPHNGIEMFKPDDDDHTLYLEVDSFYPSVGELLKKAKSKWPGITIDELEVNLQHIHTSCIGYDHYDSGDYSNFLVLSPSDEYHLRVSLQKLTVPLTTEVEIGNNWHK